MELMAKVSKGSQMDQIYLPKNRIGFEIGNYVIIKPLEKEKPLENLYFYDVKNINSLKLEVVRKIISVIEENLKDYENIIIVGSFLDEGFNFKDIDIIIITEQKPKKEIEKIIKEKLKIEIQIIFFNKDSFKEALEIDPIWRLMLNRCISKKRLLPLPTRKLKYKYLDAQLIKSKRLIENFDYLTGREKYKLVRNLIAIYLFIKNKKISEENLENGIKKNLNTNAEDIKNNLIKENSGKIFINSSSGKSQIKEDFVKKYKNFYHNLEEEIIKNAAKQEKTN